VLHPTAMLIQATQRCCSRAGWSRISRHQPGRRSSCLLPIRIDVILRVLYGRARKKFRTGFGALLWPIGLHARAPHGRATGPISSRCSRSMVRVSPRNSCRTWASTSGDDFRFLCGNNPGIPRREHATASGIPALSTVIGGLAQGAEVSEATEIGVQRCKEDCSKPLGFPGHGGPLLLGPIHRARHHSRRSGAAPWPPGSIEFGRCARTGVSAARPGPWRWDPAAHAQAPR